tara:strand:+ start:581 stop:871 length:291 start_codon:yes stop_codon:yes gene_type:complete
MFWLIYIIVAIFFSFVVSSYNKKYPASVFITLLILLLTPSLVAVDSDHYSPAIPAFFFNLIFEQDYSLRVLRPILFSLPVIIFCLWLLTRIRKKLF